MSKSRFLDEVSSAADKFAHSVVSGTTFTVDCEVEIVSDNNESDNVGLRGKVVGIDTTKKRDTVMVKCLSEDGFYGGHVCEEKDGLMDDGEGRFFAPENLKVKYPYAFEPGDYARITVDNSESDNVGKAVTVAFRKEDNMWVGVESAERLAGGHTLNGEVTEGHGRFYPASQLEHINGTG